LDNEFFFKVIFITMFVNENNKKWNNKLDDVATWKNEIFLAHYYYFDYLGIQPNIIIKYRIKMNTEQIYYKIWLWGIY